MSRILIIDDDPNMLTFARNALKGDGYEIDSASDSGAAFVMMAKNTPDLVLLHLSLPGADGHEILEVIRNEPRYDTIPVVVFSASDDLDNKIKNLDMGAADFLSKPIAPQELAARIRALLRLKTHQDKLLAEHHRLSELSLSDPLTGAYNRRALNTFLKARLAESSRHKIPFSCVMFDLDHFKDVNDNHGHVAGDLVLREITTLTLSLCRREDALIRYGGEEFLAILFHTSREGARTFSERLRSEVASRVFNLEQASVRITLSVGIASHPEDAEYNKPEEMITLADRRLYIAKGAGRNRVVFEG